MSSRDERGNYVNDKGLVIKVLSIRMAMEWK